MYKNKVDRSDCNNSRGISLLCTVGKVLARIVLRRLKILGDRVYPESQSGFRGNRSTTDILFSIRQLQEKCREQNQPLYVAFIDLTKAFDLVSRKGLFNALRKIGCPPTLLSIIESFHTGTKGTINFDGETSEKILGLKWQDKVTNTEVLERAGTTTVFSLLNLRRLRWLGHTWRMEDGRVPKDIFCGELKTGRRCRGRPLLRYKDVCKRDINDTGIEADS
ncbi:unnamed protein product [Candidula unifasciata]|uniref:Reverse transcriptase domain-containing protein n=1 Tax=Candidula unifasciata TaxID=100452 RepID=A0A8S3YK26_9EUPU|nr:unnamed protein product [Candidula unifasciata]